MRVLAAPGRAGQVDEAVPTIIAAYRPRRGPVPSQRRSTTGVAPTGRRAPRLPPGGRACRGVCVDPVRPGCLQFRSAVAAREKTDTHGTGPLRGEQVPHAVPDDEAVSGIDVEQARGSQEQMGVGLGPFH